jgi:hypothetical protein
MNMDVPIVSQYAVKMLDDTGPGAPAGAGGAGKSQEVASTVRAVALLGQLNAIESELRRLRTGDQVLNCLKLFESV